MSSKEISYAEFAHATGALRFIKDRGKIARGDEGRAGELVGHANVSPKVLFEDIGQNVGKGLIAEHFAGSEIHGNAVWISLNEVVVRKSYEPNNIFLTAFENALATVVEAPEAHLPKAEPWAHWLKRETLVDIILHQRASERTDTDSAVSLGLAEEVARRFVSCVADRGYQAQQSNERSVRLATFDKRCEANDIDDAFLLSAANELNLPLFRAAGPISKILADFWVQESQRPLQGNWGELRRLSIGLSIVPAEPRTLSGFGDWG